MKVALIQADLLWEDKAGNLKQFEGMFADLDKDVDLIVLPEMFTTGLISGTTLKNPHFI